MRIAAALLTALLLPPSWAEAQVSVDLGALGPPARRHDLAGANVDAQRHAPGRILAGRALRSFLHLPQVIFSLVHEIQFTPGPAGAGAETTELVALFTA